MANEGAEIELLRRMYAALNRNDIDGVLECFDDDMVWSEPEGFPGAGTYRGLEQIRKHFVWARGQWAEGSCEPERFVTAGGKVAAFVVVHVRMNGSTDWIDGRVVDVGIFRNGKAIQMRSFMDPAEALAWAES
jgi:ketosteroid isomerase-like protein